MRLVNESGKYFFIPAILVPLVLLLSSCGGGSGGESVKDTGLAVAEEKLIVVSGAAQKGPFLSGSQISVTTLSADGTPFGDPILSEVSDDLGSFRFGLDRPGPVLITADGFQYNEINGTVSTDRLVLRAVFNASDNVTQTANVNVLTHLSYERTIALLSQGYAIEEAIEIVEGEVVRELSPVLPGANIAGFNQLNLYELDANESTGSGYLLALSAILYQYALLANAEHPDASVESHLSEILDLLSADFGHDGDLANELLFDGLISASRIVRPQNIRENLAAWSMSATHAVLPVADLNLFIDSDGDGVVNAADSDGDNDGIPDNVDTYPFEYSDVPLFLSTNVRNGIRSNEVFRMHWQTSEYAAAIEIQIAVDPAFSTIVLNELVASTELDTTLQAGVYYLRARTQSVAGTWGPWSETSEIPVDTFSKTYVTSGGTRWDWATQFIATSDSGFLVTEAAPAGPDASDFGTEGVVQKLDTMGNVQWRTVISTPFHDRISSPFQTSDGGYLIVVDQKTDTTGKTSTRVTKLNGLGQVQWWSPTLAESATEQFYPSESTKFVEDSDGIVIGLTSPLPDRIVNGLPVSDRVPYLVKLNDQGEPVWSHSFDDSDNTYDALTGLWKGPSGDYVIAGNNFVVRAVGDSRVSYQPFMLALSADRTARTVISPLDGLATQGFHSVPTTDGGFVVSGSSPELGIGDWRAWVFGFSATGATLYSRKMDAGCQCSTTAGGRPQITANGSLFYGGDTQVWGTLDSGTKVWGSDRNRGILIVEADSSSGEVIQRRYFGAPDPNTYLRSFIALREGGFAVLGDLLNGNGSRAGFVLIKTDQLGNAPSL